MQIEAGGILAKCFSCGGNDFAPLHPRPDETADKLVCTGCCSEVLYDDLRSQIGRAAIMRKLVGAPYYKA